MRYCHDIKMFVIDRGIPHSCVHATEFCRRTCYNNKLYKLYPAMAGADQRLDREWAALDPADIAEQLSRKRRPTTRVRLCSRGEPFRDYSDVDRVEQLLRACPDTTWWIPTRAWRNPILAVMIQSRIASLPNAAVLASTDPTTSQDDYDQLVANGWSTMHYGDDGLSPKPFRCPKTFGAKIKGACAVCKRGCFAPSLSGRRVDVLLKQH